MSSARSGNTPGHDAKRDRRRKARARGRLWAGSLAQAVLAALLIRAFVAEAHVIPSESMTPTLQVGDRIFADKLSYGLSVPFTEIKLADGVAPQRGQVVIFTHPLEGTRLVKRVAAVGGDTIALRGGRVLVNGRAVPRRRLQRSCASVAGTQALRYLPEPCTAFAEQLGGARYVVLDGPGGAHPDFGPVTVPPGRVFMLGDNRPRSADSRVWGTVPYSHLKGQARVIWWSRNDEDGLRWRRLGRL